MAERDVVDPGGGVERWVLIGHSLHQHYRVSMETKGNGRDVDLRLPRCPRCLVVMAETPRAEGVPR